MIIWKTPVSYDAMSKAGNRYLITFKSSKIFDKAVIRKLWEKVHEDYVITDIQYKHPYLYIKIRIVHNPIPIAIIVIGFLGVLGLFIGFLSLQKVEQIIDVPAGIVLAGALLAFSLTGLLKAKRS